MAIYQGKTWNDARYEYPTRYTVKHSDLTEEQVTMINDFGQELQSGDVFDAATFNDLESRINAGFASCIDTLAGTSAPTGSQGKNGDTYFQYETDGNETTITAMFVKISGSWLEVAVGGASLPQAEGGAF